MVLHVGKKSRRPTEITFNQGRGDSVELKFVMVFLFEKNKGGVQADELAAEARVRLNLRGRWQRVVHAFVLLLPVRRLQDRARDSQQVHASLRRRHKRVRARNFLQGHKKAVARCRTSVLDLAQVNPSHLREVSVLWHQSDLLLSVEEYHVELLFTSHAASMASSVYRIF